MRKRLARDHAQRDRLTQPRPVKGRTVRGLNFFSRAEQTLLAALQRPAFNIAGLATGFSAVCPLLRRLMAIARHPVISKWNQWFHFAALLADALRADEALRGDVATPVDEGLGELPARALVNSTRTHITAVRNGGLGER